MTIGLKMKQRKREARKPGEMNVVTVCIKEMAMETEFR